MDGKFHWTKPFFPELQYHSHWRQLYVVSVVSVVFAGVLASRIARNLPWFLAITGADCKKRRHLQTRVVLFGHAPSNGAETTLLLARVPSVFAPSATVAGLHKKELRTVTDPQLESEWFDSWELNLDEI